MPLIEVCYDQTYASTMWSRNLVRIHNTEAQKAGRSYFIQSRVYEGPEIKTDIVYNTKSQKETMAKILKSVDRANKLIQIINEKDDSSDQNLVFSRGHMTPRNDQMFRTQQFTTMIFTNISPQWQRFNNVHWAKIERETKVRCQEQQINGIEIDVYTGTYGIFKYADADGDLQPIYLVPADENCPNPRIPVPLYFYKVLIAPSTQSGIVFIGVNDPHRTVEDIEANNILCPDISEKSSIIDWTTHNRKDVKSGYSYACSVKDFVEVVQDLPPAVKPYENLLH